MIQLISTTLTALLLSFFVLAGTACGNKGPLYLPDNTPTPTEQERGQ
ncbi:MAG: lipoprotein [Porticoccaceae bacterium]